MLWVPASPISSPNRLLAPISSATCRTLSSIASRVGLSPHALSLSDDGSVIGRPAQERDAASDCASAAYPGVASTMAAHSHRPLALEQNQGFSSILVIPKPPHGAFQGGFNGG